MITAPLKPLLHGTFATAKTGINCRIAEAESIGTMIY
jgi:hypothetical protein